MNLILMHLVVRYNTICEAIHEFVLSCLLTCLPAYLSRQGRIQFDQHMLLLRSMSKDKLCIDSICTHIHTHDDDYDQNIETIHLVRSHCSSSSAADAAANQNQMIFQCCFGVV